MLSQGQKLSSTVNVQTPEISNKTVNHYKALHANPSSMFSQESEKLKLPK